MVEAKVATQPTQEGKNWQNIMAFRVRGLWGGLETIPQKTLFFVSNKKWNCYLLTYLLTELSTSRGAANCSATQELPSILCNPKDHYRVHKSPPLVPILSRINPVHSIPSYFSKIHFTIVCPPTYVLFFPVVSFLLAFPPISYWNC
jgi:hypothetical protein